jgi:hypothetical protein
VIALVRGYLLSKLQFPFNGLEPTWTYRVSGYNEAQASTQLAILQQLTATLRSGKYTGSLGIPSKIVQEDIVSVKIAFATDDRKVLVVFLAPCQMLLLQLPQIFPTLQSSRVYHAMAAIL